MLLNHLGEPMLVFLGNFRLEFLLRLLCMLPYFSWQFSVGSFQLLNFELILFLFYLTAKSARFYARFAKFCSLAKTLRRQAFLYFIFILFSIQYISLLALIGEESSRFFRDLERKAGIAFIENAQAIRS